MGLMPPTDSMFLLAESRDQPMHVGGLQVFTPPDGAGPDFLLDLYRSVLTQREMTSLFRRRPRRSLGSLGQWTWVLDDEVDLEYHVRHSALPRPGRVRELFALVSRLHGTPLDRHRPLWEAHLIEGMADGRFAVYTKLHHSLMDGISALKLLERSLSKDPESLDQPPPWSPALRPEQPPAQSSSLLSLPLDALRALPAAARTGLDIAGLGPALAKYAAEVLREPTTGYLGQAPRTILNRPITGARRFAGQSYDLERVRRVGRATDATVNDVVLAMCSSALRRYLLDLDALPDDPLIAMTPVSLRNEDDGGEEGNAVGVILCNLATHIADPAERLAAVHSSMNQGKKVLRSMSQLQVTAVSALTLLPLLLESGLGVQPPTPPPYNLVISNIPGPAEPLYLNQARLQGMYPLSIPTAGQALNITVTSYAGELQFGLVGCRRAAPHLQRLLTHLEDSLDELEKVTA